MKKFSLLWFMLTALLLAFVSNASAERIILIMDSPFYGTEDEACNATEKLKTLCEGKKECLPFTVNHDTLCRKGYISPQGKKYLRGFYDCISNDKEHAKQTKARPKPFIFMENEIGTLKCDQGVNSKMK